MKKKAIYVRDIKSGGKVSDYFLVTEKNLSFSQKGAPYLSIRLRDKTGELDAKIWDNASELDKVFKRGDIVRIESRAVNYRNNVQLSVLEVKTAGEDEIDIRDFLPTAARDSESMLKDLLALADSVENPHLRALLACFFQDEEILACLKTAPAAKGFHHVYIGGLLEHTLSVTRLLDSVCRHYQGVSRDMVLTGGILHDIGKIHEFSYQRIIDYTDQGRLVGHIIIGVEMVDDRIAVLENYPVDLALELRHLILSHHGELEYGSPKRPKTVEALVVHFIDDLDAKVNAFQEFIGASTDEDSDWTPFHRLFERYIYKGAPGNSKKVCPDTLS